MKAICITAIVISVTALIVSLWTEQQADSRAEQALQRREKAIVDKYKPEVDRICKDLGLKERPQDPQTLDELFRPLVELSTDLSK
jgi:hypothetical protein